MLDNKKTLADQLTDICETAFREVYGESGFGQVIQSARPDLAHFQCNGAMAAAKSLRTKPMEIAQKIADNLVENTSFHVSVSPPGFINFMISDQTLISHVNALKKSDDFHFYPLEEAPNVIIDYGGPNAAKAMHVGHLRSAVIGQALKKIFRYAGYSVDGDIHMGDWGLQMGQLICEIQDRFPDAKYFTNDETQFPSDPFFSMDDLLEWYPAASGRSKSDEDFRSRARKATFELQNGKAGYRALWQHMVDVSIADIKTDYDRLGIQFEQWFGESRYQDRLDLMVDKLVSGGKAEESDGALVIRVGDDLPPLILRNSDGGYGYASTDIATIDERVNDFSADLVLYVVDKRQSMHFEQVFRATAQTGVSAGAALEHLPFGTVNGKDGKPFKTREGGVMRLGDLIEMLVDAAKNRLLSDDTVAMSEKEVRETAEKIGVAAVKFGDLFHDRESDYIFDLDKFTQFEGNTGPYLQYTCVRIMSLLRTGIEKSLYVGEITSVDEEAKPLIISIDNFKNAIQKTIEARKPHILAAHLIDVANKYNSFYTKNRVFGVSVTDEEAVTRLSVAYCARNQLVLGLKLLGIAVPDKM